jgi:aspartate ammonia-lyase
VHIIFHQNQISGAFVRISILRLMLIMVQTARTLENFQVSGIKTNFYPDYVKAYAMVKLAAARANTDIGRMKQERLALMVQSGS